MRDIASEYANRSRESSEKRQQLHGLRRAANALVRIGFYADARPYLEEVMTSAIRLKLPSQSFATSDVLLRSFLFAGQLDDALVELRRQRELLPRVDSVATRAMLRYSEIQYAWLTDDKALARRLWSTKPDSTREYLAATDLASRIGELALRRMIAPASLRKADLNRCTELLKRGAGFGSQDVNVSVLLRVLHYVGQSEKAKQIELLYREKRRELSGDFHERADAVKW